jgi:hypothetical protein
MTQTSSVGVFIFLRLFLSTNLRIFLDALSHGEFLSLNMGSLKAAQSSSISWQAIEKAPLPAGYQPVMGLAQNHIYFLNVPGVSAGSAQIFVIHCKFHTITTLMGRH